MHLLRRASGLGDGEVIPTEGFVPSQTLLASLEPSDATWVSWVSTNLTESEANAAERGDDELGTPGKRA